MAWKKESDTAAYHPIVLAPLTFVQWPEHLTGLDFANLVWGVISRAATQSAQYKTDYVVRAGVLANTAGDNWRHWVAVAVRAGYLTPVELDSGEEAWLLVEDSEDLFHIRRRAEIEWEARRKKDNANDSLTVPVRLRDGDGCRYCGCVVDWNARRGSRAGTYDHRIPGRGAQGPEDLRIACAACNGRRKDREDADEILPPKPVPASPFYGEETVDLLAKHGHQVTPSNPPRPRSRRDPASKPQRPGRQPGTARSTQRPASHADPAPAPPATPQPAGHRSAQRARTSSSSRLKQRPGIQSDTARDSNNSNNSSDQHKPRPTETADRECTEVRNPGRVGNGSGREPPPVPAPGLDSKTRRSRGRRSRPLPPQGREHGQGHGQGD
ncbi:MAG TPA: hypothetical protein VF506_00155 [Streptosporangiaceae bacterium]